MDNIHICGNLEGTHEILAYFHIISIIYNINKDLNWSLDFIVGVMDESLETIMKLPVHIQDSRYYLEKEIVMCDRINTGIKINKKDVCEESERFEEPFVEYKILGFIKTGIPSF